MAAPQDPGLDARFHSRRTGSSGLRRTSRGLRRTGDRGIPRTGRQGRHFHGNLFGRHAGDRAGCRGGGARGFGNPCDAAGHGRTLPQHAAVDFS
jgi:hypothetical protein